MADEIAVIKLREAGLVAEHVGGSDQRIIGGTSRTKQLGFYVYTHSFAIYREEDNWVVVITGPGQTDTIKKLATLEDAVKTTCKVYSERTSKSIVG